MPRHAALLGLIVVLGLAVAARAQLVTVQPPASTTTARVDADFQNSTVVLRASPAGLEPDIVPRLVRPDGSDIPSTGLLISREGSEITLRGTIDDLISALTVGTRSLWLRGAPITGHGLHRIDLPPVELQTRATAVRYPSFDEGLVLYLPTKNLMPGFQVRHFGPGMPGNKTRVLPTETGSLPRVTDVYRDQIRVILPFGAPRSPAEVHYVLVVNRDGSRSGMLKITRQGDRLTAPTVTVRPAEPAPADQPVAAPGVELETLAEAMKRAESAGLMPVVFELTSMKPVPKEDLAAIRQALGTEPIVVRQGVAPATTMRVGDSFYLGIRDPRQVPETPIATAPGDVADGSGLGIPGEPALGPGDELGFAELGLDGNPSTGGGRPLDESLIASQLGDASDDDVTTLSLGDDPGLSLDPTRTGEDLQQAGLVKLFMHAVAGQPDRDDPAGTIGRAIATAVHSHEERFLSEVACREPDVTGLLDAMFQDVASELNLKLEPERLDEAASRWLAGHRGLGLTALDRNRNRLITDDVAVWFLVWLFREGLFDPLAGVRVVDPGAGLGRLVAVIGAGDGQRKDDGPRPALKLGRREDQARSASSDRKTPEPTLPDGPAQTRLDVPPSRVKLPEFEGQSVQQAFEELGRLGLKLSDLSDLFSSDTIASSRPDGGAWLPTGSAIELVVTRKAPKVVGLTLAKAEVNLKQWKLTHETLDDGPRPTDVVAEQEPAPGDPIEQGGTVRLRLARAVPDVVQQFVFEGGRMLHHDRFRPVQAADLARWDRIVEQSPAAGTMAPIASEVDLTVRREIPDLRGKSFAESEPILEDRHIPVRLPENFSASDSIFVADQEPRPGTSRRYGPEGGDPLTIVLTRGRRVPDLREMPLEQAIDRLEDLDLRVDSTDGNLGDQIPLKVLGQDQKVGEIIAYDTLVRLKVGPIGVLIPDLQGMTLASAIAKLKAVDLGVTYEPSVFFQDIVVAQNPPPYGPDSPSWLPHKKQVRLDVRVKAPEITQRSVADAQRVLKGWDLQADLSEPSFDQDWVVDQDPAPGTLLEHGGQVRVVAKVIVPDVRNQRFSDASRILRDWDLAMGLDVDPNQFDVVSRQTPAPRSLLDHGGQVQLELLVPVPALAGLTRDQAVDSLRSRDLEPSIRNRLAYDDDIVQGQQPQPNTLIPHRAQVMIGPIAGRVPRVEGLTLGQARDLLADQRFDARSEEGLRADDRVTGQNPVANVLLERGGTIFLDARIPAPDFRGMSLVQAADSVLGRDVPIRVEPDRQGRPDDRILDQSISPGTPIQPRSTIEVVPGYRVPRLIGLSIDEADNLLGRLDISYSIDRQRIRERETDNPRIIGRVEIVDQSLQPERFVPRGTRIDLDAVRYIEAGQSVPNVRGMGALAARSRLRHDGFKVTVFIQGEGEGNRRQLRENEMVKVSEGYIVIDQFPRSPARRPRGDTIEILVDWEQNARR